MREDLDVPRKRVLACFQGSAEKTAYALEPTWAEYPYENLTQNPRLADVYAEHFEDPDG